MSDELKLLETIGEQALEIERLREDLADMTSNFAEAVEYVHKSDNLYRKTAADLYEAQKRIEQMILPEIPKQSPKWSKWWEKHLKSSFGEDGWPGKSESRKPHVSPKWGDPVFRVLLVGFGFLLGYIFAGFVFGGKFFK